MSSVATRTTTTEEFLSGVPLGNRDIMELIHLLSTSLERLILHKVSFIKQIHLNKLVEAIGKAPHLREFILVLNENHQHSSFSNDSVDNNSDASFLSKLCSSLERHDNKVLQKLTIQGISLNHQALANLLLFQQQRQRHYFQIIRNDQFLHIHDSKSTHKTTRIRHLNLAHTNMTCQDMNILAPSLLHLQSLNLSHCSLGDESARILCQCLLYSNNNSLQILNLNGNGLSFAIAHLLGRLVNHLSSLQQLYLSDNALEDEGARLFFSRAFTSTNNLCILDLSRNGLGPSTMKCLQQIFITNSNNCHHLERLILDGNDCRLYDFLHLALGLASSVQQDGLQQLFFRNCPPPGQIIIQDHQDEEQQEEIIKTLTHCIPRWKSLCHLDLTGSTPYFSVGASLLENHSLQNMMHSFKDNLQLHEFKMTTTTTDCHFINGIQFYLKRNKIGWKLLQDQYNTIPSGLWPHILERLLHMNTSLAYFILSQSNHVLTRENA